MGRAGTAALGPLSGVPVRTGRTTPARSVLQFQWRVCIRPILSVGWDVGVLNAGVAELTAAGLGWKLAIVNLTSGSLSLARTIGDFLVSSVQADLFAA